MTCWRCSRPVAAGAAACLTCGAEAPSSPVLAATEPASSAAGAWPAAGPAGDTSPQQWSAPVAVPRRLASWLVGLLAVGVVTDLVGVLSGVRYLAVLSDLLDPSGTATEQQVVGVETAYASVGIVQLVVYLACVVLFLLWLSRVDGAVRELGAVGLRHSHGWAVGAWFVPFLNLVRPKQVVDDVWRASEPDLPAGAGMLLTPPAPRWLMVWWALWVLMNIVYWRSLDAGETLEDLQGSVRVTLAGDLLSAAAGVLAVLLVLLLTRRVGAQAAARDRLAP